MDAAARYARHFLLGRPGVVVLRAPTGYLKTSSTRIAAQHARAALILDCRELVSAAALEAALGAHAAAAAAVPAPEAAGARGTVDDFVAFENAEAALGKPDVLAAIHAALERRGPRQTMALCSRRTVPLPAGVLAGAVELTHEDLALDVGEELAERGLSPERVAEIRRLTLGWPMPPTGSRRSPPHAPPACRWRTARAAGTTACCRTSGSTSSTV
jgi:hypothetical protein